MQLSDGTNAISDELFNKARNEMRERHFDEYETVHNGSGRSEEMPSDLKYRHEDESKQLYEDRRTLGVQEWKLHYPGPLVMTGPDPMQEKLKAEVVSKWEADRQAGAALAPKQIGGRDGDALHARAESRDAQRDQEAKLAEDQPQKPSVTQRIRSALRM